MFCEFAIGPERADATAGACATRGVRNQCVLDRASAVGGAELPGATVLAAVGTVLITVRSAADGDGRDPDTTTGAGVVVRVRLAAAVSGRRAEALGAAAVPPRLA